MTKRLETILKHIENGRGVIDVGTDHAYLPIELVRRGYDGVVIASDINEAPLNKARANAADAGVEDRISFLLSDGLDCCSPDEVDTIVIAGMGGDMICHILDRAEWCMSEEYKLILQPMTKAEILRYWLVNNGFIIRHEERVKENGIIYQIIVCDFEDNMPLNDAELFIGKYELVKDSPLFTEEVQLLLSRFEKAAEGMKSAPKKAALRRLYLGIISELNEMRNEHDNS